MKKFYLILFLILLSSPLQAGYPEIKWREIETEHFIIIFPEGRERYAAEVSRVAERAYPVYREKYGVTHPEKTIITLWDTGEISNGATYYFWNFIRIDGFRGYFYLRDTTSWWRNVISHEYSHDISLLSAQPFTRSTQGIFAGINGTTSWGEYGGEFFLPSYTIPRWLAEGIAQSDSEMMGGDRWDSIRDMLLRMKLLGGKYLKIDQLGTIRDKGFTDGEMVYNEGFSLVRYINSRSPGLIPEILKTMGKKWYPTFESAYFHVTGKNWEKEYAEWVSEQSRSYIERIKNKIPRTGASVSKSWEILKKIRFYHNKPLFIASPPGGYPPGNLYSGYFTGETKLIKKEVWDFTTDPQGRGIYISSSDYTDPLGYHYTRLFFWDGRKIRRIHTDVRFYALSSTGNKICGVGWKGDSLTYCTMEKGGSFICEELPFEDILSLLCRKNGVFMVVNYRGRGLLVKKVDDQYYYLAVSGNIREVFLKKKELYFSWDRNGIYNIYALSLTDNSGFQITDTISGAFSPFVKNGFLYHVEFTGDGFQIYKLPIKPLKKLHFTWKKLKFKKEKLHLKSHPYSLKFLPPLLFPELMVSYGRFKAGFTAIIRDALDLYSLEGEFLLGRDVDIRIRNTFDFTVPTLYLNFYYFRRSKDYLAKFGNLELKKDIYIYEGGFKYSYLYPFYFQGYLYNRKIEEKFIGFRHEEMMTTEAGIISGYFRGDDLAEANPRDSTAVILTLSGGHSRLPEVKNFTSEKKYSYFKITGNITLYFPLPANSSLYSITKGGFIDHPVERYDNFFIGGWINYLSAGEYHIENSFPGYELFFARWYFDQTLGIRLPLWEGEKQTGVITHKGVYFSIFGDAGMAKKVTYNSINFKLVKKKEKIWLKDYGAELRYKSYLFYSNPWDSFLKMAYSPSEKNFRIYAGIGIGF